MNLKLSFETLIKYHADCLATEGRSHRTIGWYENNLKRFRRFLVNYHLPEEVQDIGLTEARRFVYYLQNETTRWDNRPNTRDLGKLSPFSILGYARSIKAFWSWLSAEDYIQENPMLKLKLPAVPKKVIATYSPEHIKKMISQLDRNKANGFRDYTFILLLLDTGIRLSELANLKVEDIDFKQSLILINGKGNKQRFVPIGVNVRKVLLRYINIYRPQLEYPVSDNLLLTTCGEPLKRDSIRGIILRLGSKAGITGVRISCHTFRHSFSKEYLMQGGDIFSLQRILGHSSLEMVKAYINLAMSDVSRQHRKFSPVDNVVFKEYRR